MIRIVHLSDSHFGTTSDEKLMAIETSIRELKPDLILLSGDITQRAKVREFNAAREFLDRFSGTPIISTPGNHDISLTNFFERLLYPYRRYSTILKHPPEARWRKGDVEVVCMNSTSRFRHKDGALNAIELSRLNERSDGVKFRVAVFHHPMDCARPSDQKNIIEGSERIAAKLQAEDIDLVVGGHIHDPLMTLSTHRYPGRAFVISVAGTCLSSRTRYGVPNSFSVYDIEGSQLGVHRYDFAGASAFQRVSSCQFRRHQSEWTVLN
jgi:3',5'-cyclic AMP phosphodiesterase CpdA